MNSFQKHKVMLLEYQKLDVVGQNEFLKLICEKNFGIGVGKTILLRA